MKKSFTKYGLIFSLLLAAPAMMRSQDAALSKKVSGIEIFTDRTIFVAGEAICLSAMRMDDGSGAAMAGDRVLYCEIISPDGSHLAAAKYPLEKQKAQGCLRIPEETITGNYYLKSYTRSMRNGPVSDYTFQRIIIINPNRTEVLAGSGEEDLFPADQSDPARLNPLDGFLLKIDKKIYSHGEDIGLELTVKNEGEPAEKACLSVIPESTYRDNTFIEYQNLESENDLVYYPETRGISLSGTLLDDLSGRPVPGALVNLSIVGDKDCMAIRTDSSGRFFFALPDYTGNHDIFLCAEEIPGLSSSILIDNDFCSRPVDLPSLRFSMTEQEKAAAYGMAVNRKIASVFELDTITEQIPSPKHENPFYGIPTETLILDNYIELPTLEEYFNELPVAAKVRKEQGKKVFRFFTSQTDMSIYEPLVMVDWVAVNDIGRVLSMSPREIDRIELVNATYIKGSITYGGIISFVSKNNDFAGIDLPSSGTFINYMFFEGCAETFPAGDLPANIPDTRNTIYWDPDLVTEEAGPTKISFRAPAAPGRYSILLRGMTAAGAEFMVRETFEVQ